jgi:hypothetical protein
MGESPLSLTRLRVIFQRTSAPQIARGAPRMATGREKALIMISQVEVRARETFPDVFSTLLDQGADGSQKSRVFPSRGGIGEFLRRFAPKLFRDLGGARWSQASRRPTRTPSNSRQSLDSAPSPPP